MTRLASVAAMARIRPGQSAWSLIAKPRSKPSRRRRPRSCIQPLANAALASAKGAAQALSCAPGGATTSARRRSSALSDSRVRVGGKAMPASR
jgi:hypothetical protein